MKKLELVCIMILTIINVNAQSKKQILNEQFDNNSSNWEIVNNSSEITIIKKGKYSMKVIDENNWHWFAIDTELNWDNDFFIETSIEKTKSKTKNDFLGLIWGAESNNNLYVFQISPLNKVYSVLVLKNGKWYSLVDFKKSDEIKPEKYLNKLGVKKIENNLFFLINDNIVEKISSQKSFGKKVGFYVSPDLTIEADNLIINEIYSNSLSQKNILNEDDLAELANYYKTGQFKKLEEKTFEFLKNKTQTEELSFFLGSSFMSKRNFREATKHFENVVENNRIGYKPTFPLLGQCLVNLERFDDAIIILTKAIEYGYGDYSFLYRGRSYLRKKDADIENAIYDLEYFLSLIKSDESYSKNDFATTYYYLGNAYLEKASSLKDSNFINAENNFVKSIELYNKAIEYDKDSYIYYRDLGIAHTIFNQEEKAVLYFKKSLEINENQPEIIKMLNNLNSNYLSNRIKLKKKDGVYHIPVKLNSVLDIDFIFDSGASDVSITPEIALTLIKTGTIKESDWLEGAYYQFADGSIAESKRFKLKSVKVGDKTVYDVTCSISNNLSAPMLLGQSVMEKFGKYTFDYKTNELIID